MLKNLGVLSLLITLLNGCSSTAISTNHIFNENSKNGLALLGVESSHSIYLQLAKIDSSKNKLDVGVVDRGGLVVHEGRFDKKYYILDLKPGTYVFRDISEYKDNAKKVICFTKGTYKFDIKPGKAVYLGDVLYSASSPIITTGDHYKASTTMLAYPNITVTTEQAILEPFKFENSALAFLGDGCGSYF